MFGPSGDECEGLVESQPRESCCSLQGGGEHHGLPSRDLEKARPSRRVFALGHGASGDEGFRAWHWRESCSI